MRNSKSVLIVLLTSDFGLLAWKVLMESGTLKSLLKRPSSCQLHQVSLNLLLYITGSTHPMPMWMQRLRLLLQKCQMCTCTATIQLLSQVAVCLMGPALWLRLGQQFLTHTSHRQNQSSMLSHCGGQTCTHQKLCYHLAQATILRTQTAYLNLSRLVSMEVLTISLK